MKWMENFALVMRTSITRLRESVEDPERMLHQLIIDMEEEFEHVKASVAEAIADEILLAKRVAEAREESSRWRERAEGALQRGDESAARSALDQQMLAEQRVAALEKEHVRQKEQTEKLRRSVHDLQEKIRQARQKRVLLVARLARTESERRINQALDRAESGSALAQFRRLEERVERSEAIEQAYDRLEDRDPQAEELERRFEEEERRQRLEDEFEKLRRRVQDEAGE